MLLAIAEGEAPGEAIAALADAVLAAAPDAVRLAVQVRDGGRHAARAAIELAAVILAAEQTAAAREGEG